MGKIMSSKKYCNGGGCQCPVCKSQNITAGNYNAGGKTVSSVVSCEECGSYWTEFYWLAGYDNLKKGKA